MDAAPKSLKWHQVKICCVPSLKVNEKDFLVLQLLWPPASHWENAGDPRTPKGGKQDRWAPQRLQQEVRERNVSKAKDHLCWLQKKRSLLYGWNKAGGVLSRVSPPASLTQREERPITAIVYLLMAYRLNKQREIHLLYPKAYRAQGCSMKLSRN